MSNFITDNLDIWTSSLMTKKSVGRGSSKKQEAYGIKKLRELILELAVRGKLVPQDTSDEPASFLIEKIAEEKERLVEKGEIRKQKALSVILDKHIPFSLPNNWAWCRLGNTGIGATGKTPSTKDLKNFDGKIPFIGPGQITPSGEILKADKFVSEIGIEYSTEALKGDLLMVCIGGSIGKSAIANQRLAFNQQLNLMRPLFIIPKYLKIAVSTDMFYTLLLEKSTGSATPIINRGKWEELLVPLPPLAEQKRIVSKVDELMALCDKLEEEQEENSATHQILVETLLSTLTNEETPEAFTQSWQRIAGHFDVLFTTEKSIDKLQETILQLAVMGKLVPQDPNDEPASVLLEKIIAESKQLVKDKQIKKLKKFKDIQENEKPFSIPHNWEYVRLNDIGEWGAGATPTRGNPKYYGGTIPWFKSLEGGKTYAGFPAIDIRLWRRMQAALMRLVKSKRA
jgi:type I restriction enzyme S subunit